MRNIILDLITSGGAALALGVCTRKLSPGPVKMQDWPMPIPARKEMIGDFEINYIEQGSGPALIFIHGLGANLNVWNYNFFEFAKTHRCIALDLPGFGNSAKKETEYSFDLFARTIVGLMDKLGIEKAAMIGNSMGGHTAAYLGIHFPERVDMLVLVDPSGTLKIPWYLKLFLLYPEFSASLIHRLFIKRLEGQEPEKIKTTILATGKRFPILLNLFFHDAATHPAEDFMNFFVGHLATIISKAQFHYFLRTFSRLAKRIDQTNLTPDLPRIKAPTLLIWGDDDRQVPLRFAKIFHRQTPGSKFLIISHAGHIPMIEKPDEFNCALKEFLEK